MTVNDGTTDLQGMAASNNGTGVIISGPYTGYWVPMRGSVNDDGFVTLSLIHEYAGSPNRGKNFRIVARDGAFYEFMDGGTSCTWWPIQSCKHVCFGSLSDTFAFGVKALIGKNDARQLAAVVDPVGDNMCSVTYGGAFYPSDRLIRASAAGTLELSIPPPAGIEPPIVLGPAGEFHWGSATNLTKTDVNGVPQRTKSPTISGSIASSAWDVDAAGNILIALSFSGSVDFGNGPLTSTGPRDLGLVALDPAGNVVWQKQFGSATFTMGNVGLSRTGTSDMAVWGTYTGAMDFGTGALQGAMFLVKFDALGNALWHVDISTSESLFVAGDISGAVFLATCNFRQNFGWWDMPYEGFPGADGLAIAKYFAPAP